MEYSMGWEGKVYNAHPPTHPPTTVNKSNKHPPTQKLFLFHFFSNTQLETNNSMEIFASNTCKIFILQHIGLLIKSKFWNMVFLWFWFLLATKYACPDFIWPENVVDSVGFYWIVCFVLKAVPSADIKSGINSFKPLILRLPAYSRKSSLLYLQKWSVDQKWKGNSVLGLNLYY